MKKLPALIMALTLIISLGACADKPAQTPTPAPDPTIQPTSEPTPAPTEMPNKDNLKGFYQGLVASELLPEGTELTEQIIDGYYDGLSDIEFNQCVIYIPTFNISATEIALIELKDAADAQTVVEILANRQTALENQWKEYLPGQYELVKNAKIVQNGGFIMFAAAERAEELETAFNALFEK